MSKKRNISDFKVSNVKISVYRCKGEGGQRKKEQVQNETVKLLMLPKQYSKLWLPEISSSPRFLPLFADQFLPFFSLQTT